MEYILLPLLLVVMIFFMYRTNKKRRDEAAKLQEQVVPGVEVMTNFGLYAKLISIDEEKNTAVLETSPGSLITVHRQVVTRVIDPVESSTNVVPQSAEVAEAAAQAKNLADNSKRDIDGNN